MRGAVFISAPCGTDYTRLAAIELGLIYQKCDLVDRVRITDRARLLMRRDMHNGTYRDPHVVQRALEERHRVRRRGGAA